MVIVAVYSPGYIPERSTDKVTGVSSSVAPPIGSRLSHLALSVADQVIALPLLSISSACEGGFTPSYTLKLKAGGFVDKVGVKGSAKIMNITTAIIQARVTPIIIGTLGDFLHGSPLARCPYDGP